MKHTEGPWERVGTVVWSPGERKVIAAMSATETASGLVEFEPPELGACGEPTANARLIAAAPDLLRVAIRALSHVQELREGWRTGAIRSIDGKDAERSNRNVDIERELLDAINMTPSNSDADTE